MSVRVLIVDDEPIARRRVRSLLATDPEVEIVAECSNGLDAVEAIESGSVDLVFLDIQMPELDGFGVVEAVGAACFPAVVFVTAYDEHALRAFDVHALDYVLKPFDEDRFGRALTRAKEQVALRRSAGKEAQFAALLDAVRGGSPYLKRLLIREEGDVHFVRTADVDWIGAERNYVRVHTAKRSHRVRESISAIERKLDPHDFVRIHRSTIVNVDRIREMKPLFHGEYVVSLHDGTELVWSRGYLDRFETLVERGG